MHHVLCSLWQRKVICWLLTHDPALRPTAVELLKSDLLPPPQMEESELHEVLQHTMANVSGKAYRTMVNQLFSQNISPVMDFTYDTDIHKVEEELRTLSGVHRTDKIHVYMSSDRDFCTAFTSSSRIWGPTWWSHFRANCNKWKLCHNVSQSKQITTSINRIVTNISALLQP